MLSRILKKNLFEFAQICKTASEALKGIKDGDVILSGGFGLCGIPMNLINAVRESAVKDLTLVSDGCGRGNAQKNNDWGLGVLLPTNQVKRVMLSYIGTNKRLQQMYNRGEIEVQLTPQGTLAEKIRAGGAGIPAFYTKTGVHTHVETGKMILKYQKGTGKPEVYSKPKNSKVFNGKKYIEEESITGDFALIKAHKADKHGNLMFRKTSRNFNADMATAAKTVVVETEQLLESGEIPPQDVHVPGVYVDRIFKSDPNSKWSQKIVEMFPVKESEDKLSNLSEAQAAKFKIMKRAAKQVRNGMNVNLGIGIPLLLPSQLPPEVKINIHCENGVFQVGPYAYEQSQMDPDLINPGKEPITVLPGASYFSSSTSFGIIRGHHLDLTMLGALQCSQYCDVANWIIPGKMTRGMGGAMDLVASESMVIIVMQHYNRKNGEVQLKLLEECTLPITAKGVVSMLITELAVFRNIEGELVMEEIAKGHTLEEVQKVTGFKIKVSDQGLKQF